MGQRAFKFFVTILLVFISSFAHALDSRLFLRFFTLEQLATDPELQKLHYQALQNRFANGDFDEILFPDSSAKGPRLELEHHKLMLQAIQKFSLSQNYFKPEEFFSQRPNYAAFTLQRNQGTVITTEFQFPETGLGFWLNRMKASFMQGEALRKMSEESRTEFVRLVSKRLPRVNSIFDFKTKNLMSDSVLLENSLNAFMTLFKKDKSPQLLESAAILVMAKWFQENKILENDFDFTKLSNTELNLLKLRLQSEIVPILKRTQIPSKLANNFFAMAGFKESATSPFPKDQVVLLPMTKWEAMFKGIGPGECIRASANRFFDAFYPFSQAFSILKDGKELGYIGIYKIQEQGGSKNFWYIDTLQTPGLATDNGDYSLLDSVMDQIERFALREGATLAMADHEWNGTNYKENIPRLHARGTLGEVKVGFPDSEVLKGIFEFVAHEDQKHHQDIMTRSGYKDNSNQMYDTLLRNGYKVRVLEPSARLSEGERAQYFRNFGLGNEPAPVTDIHLGDFETLLKFGIEHPTNRLRLIEIYEKKQLLFKNSERARKLAEKALFPNVMKAFGQIPDPSEMDSIVLRANPGAGWKYESQINLVLELLPLTTNEDQVIKLIGTISEQRKDLSAQIMDYIIPILEKKGFSRWIDIYQSLLRNMSDEFRDHFVATEFSRRLKTPQEFIKFLHISEGSEKGVSAGYTENLTRLFVSQFLQMLKSINGPAEKVDFLLKVKHETRKEHDTSLVSAYLGQIRTMEELALLQRKLTQYWTYVDSKKHSQVLTKIFLADPQPVGESSFLKLMKVLDSEDAMELVKNPARLTKLLEGRKPATVLEIFGHFLFVARNDAEDLLVMNVWKPLISNEMFDNWIAYANGEKSKAVYLKLEERRKYFATELAERLQSESNPAIKSQLISSVMRRFGFYESSKYIAYNHILQEAESLLKSALENHFASPSTGKEIFDMAMKLLKVTNYTLDISDLFQRLPTIGLSVLKAAKAEGHELHISQKILQESLSYRYLLPEEKAFINTLLAQGTGGSHPSETTSAVRSENLQPSANGQAPSVIRRCIGFFKR